MNNSTLGSKYYRYIGDELEIIRVKKLQNEETVSIETQGDPNSRRKININEIRNNYILLNPDGYISFTIALLQDGVKDVIISLHRRNDILNHDNVPYCVCRQNVMDVHGNRIVQDNMKYVGASVSVETIPEDTPYGVMTACSGIEVFTNVAVYMDDTLDTILSHIQDKKYNIILEDLFNRSVNTPYLAGYTKTVRQLLTENNFMYDFRRAFNIIPLAFEIEMTSNFNPYMSGSRLFMMIETPSCFSKYAANNSDGTLSTNCQENLEHILGHKMLDIIILKYDRDINLSEIKRNYIVVCDSKENLYIISYEQGQAYTNEEYMKYIKNMDNYLGGIPIDRSKYKK